jgi:methylenetetrahydrofolate dehydrogenase (NADP+) / methenyltetrahydrofolate cyclohydrolase
MKINGTALADKIYQGLIIKVKLLSGQGIVPHLAVILVGEDPASKLFVSLKAKQSKRIGIKFTLFQYPSDVSQPDITDTIIKLNNNPKIHGIVIQQPLPKHLNKQQLINLVDIQKDVDGFCPNSSFTSPIALAVIKALEHAFINNNRTIEQSNNHFITWLHSKSIVVLGKGDTGGGPIITHLQKLGFQPHIIDTQTKNSNSIIKSADIVITTVGKPGIIKPDMLKKDVILIGVGVHKGKDGKLHGDYKSKEIRDIAAFYTPVTGGIGPLNVAYLLSNLIQSAEKQH